MLCELSVENLLLMERAQLRLAPGLNMLTGETGAGKTLLAHALDLLLGGRARRGIVRPGAAEAYVEGIFELPAALAGDERLPSDAVEIVLGRRVWADGRTRAYLCGRAATQADLQELGGRLLSFYGQHEHRRLMLSAAQLDLLDAYCGAAQTGLRHQMRAAYDAARELEAETQRLRELAGARERELDLIMFELGEIETAAPLTGEQESLIAQRDRLRHREALAQAAAAAEQAVAGGFDDGAQASSPGGVTELLARAAETIEPVSAFDPTLSVLAERLDGLRYEAEEIARELRDRLTELEADDADGTQRLEQVEERLALLSRLARKHGGDIGEVLAHAQRCRERRAELEHADDALKLVEVELERTVAERERLASRLRRARRAAAPRLAAAVRARLGELAMAGAEFELECSPRVDGCGPRGSDALEMLIAPNAGGRLAPLRETASGGELSRVMLALLSVAHGDATGGDGPATESPLLVFDEIDAGIGGHTARAVGEHLRRLAQGRQVLCITHLPQVAALADRHFTIAKDSLAAVATTTVTALEGDQIVGELVRMLGAGSDDRAASEHARELLRVA
ncbi:MAG: DNA repair protein RecN [Solirubrobacteraceae bacterium]